MIRHVTALDQSIGVPTEPPSRSVNLFAFLFSAAIHGGLLGLVAFGPRLTAQRDRRPIFESIIRPNEKRIIWYRTLPEIAPTVGIGKRKYPRGKVKSPIPTMARSPRPKSTRQLILQPAPEIKLKRDIAAPNLMAVTVPMPTRPEPKRVKTFVAPPWPGTSKRRQPVVLEEAPPELGLRIADPLPRLTGLVTRSKPPARRFIPPSASRSSAAGGGGVTLEAPPEVSRSNLSAAIVGLHPSIKLDSPIPLGSRPAQFSAAPTVGETATGEVNSAGAIVVPGVMIKRAESERVNSGAASFPAVTGSKIVLYDEVVPGSVRPGLSAPLRPASRTIPHALEARFQARFVYTMVIPAPNLPAYTGDWIVWFAEQSQKPGEVAIMRAPVPLRKIEPLHSAQTSSGEQSEVRIQLAAIIRSDGRFDSVTLVQGATTSVSQSAIEDLKRWEFRPVMRDGSPIDAEVVIEIPFSLVWLTGSQ